MHINSINSHPHANDILSNALEVEQDNSTISIQTNMNKIGLPSSNLGVGLAVPPVNPNPTSTTPRPRNGNPLSRLIVEDYLTEDKDNPNPPQIKTNINNNGKCLHNQYETSKEEKPYQYRTSLSNIKNTSRRSENNRREKEDQDQEELEENIDVGDWTARQPSVNVENNRSERRSRSGPTPIVDLDSDEITERGPSPLKHKL